MRIVLDADGVFFNERPYWRTALATALSLAGVDDITDETFRGLYAELFDGRSAQRIVKAAGINSNWYLAEALVCSLETAGQRGDVVHALARGDVAGAADRWVAALAGYIGRLTDECGANGSPIDSLSRKPTFKSVVQRFQEIFHGQSRRFNVGPKYETLGDPVVIRATFERLRRSGALLIVCTGRGRKETVDPLRQFGLSDGLADLALVTHDDVEKAEAATGLTGLAKPHWFPLAAAVCGFDSAVDALRRDCPLRRGPDGERAVFVGDGMADFRSAASCRVRGADVRFVLVQSGALAAGPVDEIRRAAFTIGVVPKFEDVPDLLAEVAT